MRNDVSPCCPVDGAPLIVSSMPLAGGDRLHVEVWCGVCGQWVSTEATGLRSCLGGVSAIARRSHAEAVVPNHLRPSLIQHLLLFRATGLLNGSLDCVDTPSTPHTTPSHPFPRP